MKTLTLFNNKGGVGKTTLTVNLAAYLSIKHEKKVLVLDADPQANSTQLVIPPEKWEELYPEVFQEGQSNHTVKTLFDPMILGDRTINTDITFQDRNQHSFSFDLIPGDPSLSRVEDILSGAWEETKSGSPGGIRTTNWLNILKDDASTRDYDFLIIDVGPSLGALNRSILLNSDFIITPMGSDIFSLMGIKNIAEWITDWRKKYTNGLSLSDLHGKTSDIAKYHIIDNIDNTTKLIGFSIQQYNSRKFKSGYRAVKAYDEIISKMPETIINTLDFIIPNELKNDSLNLGDVPYLNSIIPIAQSNNYPLFALNSSHGIRGGQATNVARYEEMLKDIVEHLLNNISIISGGKKENG